MAAGGPGAGDARLKGVKDNLLSGRERSMPMPESGRDGGAGAGDDGRLAGRRKEGVLMACIVKRIMRVNKVFRFELFDGSVRVFRVKSMCCLYGVVGVAQSD